MTTHACLPSGRLTIAMLLIALVFSGCATPMKTYRLRSGAAERIPSLKTVVAPLDAQLSELGAGGMLEQRDDWTTTAVANLQAALDRQTGWSSPKGLSADEEKQLAAETTDVQALLRAITLNYLARSLPTREAFPVKLDNLDYNTGPLQQYAATGNGAVLFVFVRNSYATAGRKALVGLSLLGAGLTGVAVVPTMGSDVVSAALVETDGSVLWFNVDLRGADPRTRDGADALAKQLLEGLPQPKA